MAPHPRLLGAAGRLGRRRYHPRRGRRSRRGDLRGATHGAAHRPRRGGGERVARRTRRRPARTGRRVHPWGGDGRPGRVHAAGDGARLRRHPRDRARQADGYVFHSRARLWGDGRGLPAFLGSDARIAGSGPGTGGVLRRERRRVDRPDRRGEAAGGRLRHPRLRPRRLPAGTSRLRDRQLPIQHQRPARDVPRDPPRPGLEVRLRLVRVRGFRRSPFLEDLHQPVLMAYGTAVASMPIVQGVQIVREHMWAHGNDALTVRYFEGADHGLHVNGELAPGLTRALSDWVWGLPETAHPAERVAGAQPTQRFLAEPVPEPHWYAPADLPL